MPFQYVAPTQAPATPGCAQIEIRRDLFPHEEKTLLKALKQTKRDTQTQKLVPAISEIHFKDNCAVRQDFLSKLLSAVRKVTEKTGCAITVKIGDIQFASYENTGFFGKKRLVRLESMTASESDKFCRDLEAKLLVKSAIQIIKASVGGYKNKANVILKTPKIQPPVYESALTPLSNSYLAGSDTRSDDPCPDYATVASQPVAFASPSPI